MKVDFVEFEKKHLDGLGEDARQMFLESDSDFEKFHGITVLYDGEVAYCMGTAMYRPGVWDIVLFPGLLFYRNTVKSFKEVSLWLYGLKQSIQWRRLQAMARDDAPHHKRFLLVLGFKEEGRLRRYAPEGYDMVMFSIIKD